jgi:hypothetical protein
MADYNRLYNLTVKDSLPTGNSAKVIKGAELDAELNAVASAIASKSDSNSPTFTGTPAAPTATLGTNTTQLATTAFVQAALNALYPVGSIYINASVTTNPASLLGFGTWVAFGEGRVIVGQNTSDTDFDVLEETGGSKSSVSSHTHTFTTGTESAGHTHTFSGQTGGQSNDHTHVYSETPYGGIAAGGGAFRSASFNTGINYTSSGVSADHSHGYSGTTSNVSANHTHSGTTASTGSSNGNLQPYVVVKMWKRTA